MTGADDDYINHFLACGLRASGHRLHPTVTVTSVGLVMMSNTADRFCDWATSAAISAFEASASMS
jgi:hypothetical protein